MLAFNSRSSTFSTITDAELDVQVQIKLSGHLAGQGILVQRVTVRCTSIHSVDPENTALRRSVAIRRQVYHVDGPNCTN